MAVNIMATWVSDATVEITISVPQPYVITYHIIIVNAVAPYTMGVRPSA